MLSVYILSNELHQADLPMMQDKSSLRKSLYQVLDHSDRKVIKSGFRFPKPKSVLWGSFLPSLTQAHMPEW